MKHLEEKIIALIHGEISGEEAKQLLDLIESDDAVKAQYEAQLELNQLLHESSQQEADSWKMESSRSESLLASLSGEEVIEVKEEPQKSPRKIEWQAAASIAACVAGTLTVAGVMFVEQDDLGFGSIAVLTDRAEKSAMPMMEEESVVAYYPEEELTINEPAEGFASVSKKLLPQLSLSGKAEKQIQDARRDMDMDELVMPKPMVTPSTKKKPAAPSKASAPVIASSSVTGVTIPAPEIPYDEPALDFGEEDGFGSGFGDGSGEGFKAPQDKFTFKSDETIHYPGQKSEKGKYSRYIRDDSIKASAKTSNSLADIAGLERERRIAAVQNVDERIKEAREAYTQKNYEKAAAIYRKTLASTPQAEILNERREFLKQSLTQASVANSKDLARKGSVAEARETLAKVLKADPTNKTAEAELDKLYDPVRTSPAGGKEHTSKVDKVRRHLYKGEGYYNLGLFEEAHAEFDKVLRQDPYNLAARRWQTKVNEEKRDYYRSAYDETRSRLLAEVDRAWEIVPVPSDLDVKAAKARQQKKLQSIIIPKVHFENVTLSEVMTFLTREAAIQDKAEQDATKKGVSMLIRQNGKHIASDGYNIKIDEFKMEGKSLGEVLHALSEKSGTKVKIEQYVVALVEDSKKLSPSKTSKPTHEIKNLNDEAITKLESTSTFSLHVSDVSFKLAKSAILDNGSYPDRSKLRPEEFVNAFDYGDPSVKGNAKVACNMEQAVHPFMQQRNLMRVSMSTAALGRSTPLRLTLLLDNSGSMERADREASVLKAMEVLVSQLQPHDEVSLISFSQNPRIIAEGLKGAQLKQLVRLVKQTPSEGGTNMEKALELAGAVAKRTQKKGMKSRIVLMTDGAANLGNAEPEELSQMVINLRQQGIAFDACGVGADKLNDEVLEALARKGDGRYYLLDKPEDADKGFAKQLAGALRPAASNVKVQVVFNPSRVMKYKLLGFEKHLLKKEDFRNDNVDAAEMASQEAGSAMYQFQAIPGGKGDIGTVFVRFRDMTSNQMVERSWTIPYQPQPKTIEEANPSMQLATTAAMLAEKIRGTDVGLVDFSEYNKVLGNLDQAYSKDQRVKDLIRMVRKVSSSQ